MKVPGGNVFFLRLAIYDHAIFWMIFTAISIFFARTKNFLEKALTDRQWTTWTSWTKWTNGHGHSGHR